METLLDPRVIGALGLMVLLTIAPGPDMALVTATSLARGRRAAFRTSLGISTGTVTWATLSGLGVAALLQASAEAFTLVRLAGAVYLCILGARALRDAFVGQSPSAGLPEVADRDVRFGRPFRQGLMTNLLNPKVGLFYTTLVPQIVDPGDPIAVVSVFVGLAHASIGLVWLALLGAAVDRAGDVLRRPRVRRALAGFTGGVLVFFGLRVVADPG